jgi:hypothetical protein
MGAAIMAHVAEHLAFSFRKKVEEQLGVPLPPPDQEMPEDVEVELSRLVAQASTQLLQLNMSKAQQAQTQQAQQDPMVQMQQAELQIKAQEAKTKEQKVQGDLAIKQAELQLKAAEMQRGQGEDPRIKAALAQQELQHKEQVHQQKMRQQAQQAALKAQQRPQSKE